MSLPEARSQSINLTLQRFELLGVLIRWPEFIQLTPEDLFSRPLYDRLSCRYVLIVPRFPWVRFCSELGTLIKVSEHHQSTTSHLLTISNLRIRHWGSLTM